MAYAYTADGQYEFFAKPKRWRAGLSRLFDAVVDGRRSAAEREIAAYLEGRGKFLSDETERQIERILSSSPHL